MNISHRTLCDFFTFETIRSSLYSAAEWPAHEPFGCCAWIIRASWDHGPDDEANLGSYEIWMAVMGSKMRRWAMDLLQKWSVEEQEAFSEWFLSWRQVTRQVACLSGAAKAFKVNTYHSLLRWLCFSLHFVVGAHGQGRQFDGVVHGMRALWPDPNGLNFILNSW